MTHEPPHEIEMYVDLGSVFPGESATSESLQEILTTLSRDDALFFCARLNIQVSGHSLTIPPMDRQRHALGVLRPPPLIEERLDQFARDHNTHEFSIFFRGQLLELAWRVAARAKNLPGDSNTFSSEQVRLSFFKAALIASDLWGQRVFRDRLADTGAQSEQLRRALGAFRKGVEESNATLDAGIALGRAWLIFGTHLPRRYAGFGDAFEKATGITLKQYFVCAFWLLRYSFPEAPDGGIFDSRIGANHAGGATFFRPFLERFHKTRSLSPPASGITIRPDTDRFASGRFSHSQVLARLF